jgi:hypothetical protein
MRPAIGRRHVLASLCATTAAFAWSRRGPDSVHAAPPPLPPDFEPISDADPNAIRIDLPQLKYGGSWSPRSGAMRVLARELRLRTRLEPVTEPSTVSAESSSLFETPFLYVAGDGGLPALGETGDAQLRRFVDLGGLILFDAADGGTDPGFTNDVRALLSRIAPASELTPVSREHVIYRSFYLVDFPFGRTQAHEHLLAIQEEGRIKVLLMRNDLGGALAETDDGLAAYPCTPGGAEQREWAIRLGVNVLLYATCTDYKADRAHVETLLRSRRWR